MSSLNVSHESSGTLAGSICGEDVFDLIYTVQNPGEKKKRKKKKKQSMSESHVCLHLKMSYLAKVKVDEATYSARVKRNSLAIGEYADRPGRQIVVHFIERHPCACVPVVIR